MGRGRLLGRHLPVDEVHLTAGKTIESRLGQAEVLRQQWVRGLGDLVGDGERAELGEVAVVKDQDEVAGLVSEALN